MISNSNSSLRYYSTGKWYLYVTGSGTSKGTEKGSGNKWRSEIHETGVNRDARSPDWNTSNEWGMRRECEVNRNIIRTYLSEIGISQSPEYTRTETGRSREEFRKGRERSVTGVQNGVRIYDPNIFGTLSTFTCQTIKEEAIHNSAPKETCKQVPLSPSPHCNGWVLIFIPNTQTISCYLNTYISKTNHEPLVLWCFEVL